MSEFDEYLERLRSALDLNPKRAAEICAEVRSHLEARAAQLATEGFGQHQAAARAMEDFGDPAAVAGDVSQANRRHRGLKASTGLLAAGLAWVGFLTAFALEGVGGRSLYDIAEPAAAGLVGWLATLARIAGSEALFHGLSGWATESPRLITEHVLMLILVFLTCPAAVLAGMIAGGRYWWLAASPPVMWGLVTVPLLWDKWLGSVCVTLVLVGGPVLTGFALLGARLGKLPWTRVIVGVVCSGYMATAAGFAVFEQVRSVGSLLALLATAELILGVLGTAILWEGGKPVRRAAVLATAACGSLLAVHALAVGQPEGVWAGVIAVQTTLGAAGIVSHLRKVGTPRDPVGATCH